MLGQLAVMHEMPGGKAAGQLGEVRDEPPVAAPPEALAAHHDRPLQLALREDLVDRGKKVRLPHVAGITAEGGLAPGSVR